MAFETIGLLHPGEMGAGVGAALVRAGRIVLWDPSGRSEQSARRAVAAGLSEAGSLAAMAERCDLILSICPPHAALEVARQVAGFEGCYLDANAIAPGTALEVAGAISSGGGRYLDGGIIGGPPSVEHPTRLYLSGTSAPEAAELFAGTPVEARVLSEDPTAASALKMCFAAWTKGSAALLLAVRALARAEGVEEPLLEEWGGTTSEQAERSLRSAQQAATKGWRWRGEMEEIAATFRAAGLPDGFHRAAAEVYARPGRDEEALPSAATLRSVLAALLGEEPPGG